jgi:hypothetical protein
MQKNYNLRPMGSTGKPNLSTGGQELTVQQLAVRNFQKQNRLMERKEREALREIFLLYFPPLYRIAILEVLRKFRRCSTY